jgi:UDP-GlcNAc:undecaprenyl-phosphate GlcNAc-1-phosphate transferase
MFSLLLLAVSSFAFSLLLTPLCRDFFLRIGILDHPDRQRKLHQRPIPRLGGIPIAVAYVAAFGVLVCSPLRARWIVTQNLPFIWGLLPAAGIIFLTGLIDDIRGLRPWQKLAGQFAGACLAYWAGVHIQGIAGFSMQTWWSFPITVGWLLVCTNAFNLIDGLDGLATGVGLFATVTSLLAAVLQSNLSLAFATAPLVGCLLGFLRYNFNPASIFLGDSGSLLIGFLLGCYGVLWTQKSSTLLGVTAPLMVLALPLFDTGLAILRRFVRGRPIFGADRDHIHHRLLDRGLTPRHVALLLYGVCGLAAACSLFLSVLHRDFAGLIILIFCAASWFGIRYLGYIEFNIARQMLLGSNIRRMVDAEVALRRFEESLLLASSLEDSWEVICRACADFGFSSARMIAGSRTWESRFETGRPDVTWTLRIPLTPYDYINLERAFDSSTGQSVIVPFVEALKRTMPERMVEQFPLVAAAAR